MSKKYQRNFLFRYATEKVPIRFLSRSRKFGTLRRIFCQVDVRSIDMKRLFNPRKRSDGEQVLEKGSTIDRIVKDKEGVKHRLEEEEREFLNKKRDAERKMIEFEKQVCNFSS